MTEVLLIINPSSGGERAKSYEEAARKKLAEFFDRVEVVYTEKGGDAEKYARQACQDRIDSVFVMGGDGTVNEGISGLAEQDYRPRFGFFPLGTVNDLARALNISLNPDEAIAEFDPNQQKTIDIGKINDKYFMNVVGMGVIPEAINSVESEHKTQWGSLAYFASALKQVVNMKYFKFTLDIDGETRELESSTLVIGLTNSIGGFENLLPGAEVDDGCLHLIYIKDSNLIDSIKAVPRLLSGVEESGKSVGYIKFKKARICLLDEGLTLNVNVDGDEGDELPIEVSVLPSHIEVYSGRKKQNSGEGRRPYSSGSWLSL